MEDERRDADRRQDLPNVDLCVHLRERQGRPRARGEPEISGELFLECHVGCEARRQRPGIHCATPVPFDFVEELLAFLRRWRPRVFRIPDPAGVRPDGDQRRGTLRVGRGEEHRHAATLRLTHDRGAFGPGRVHHRTNVVHPLFERGQVTIGDAVRHAGAAFVEQNQAAEGGEPASKSRLARLVPPGFEVRHPAGNVHDVARTVANHLVGDADGTAARVASGGLRGHLPAEPRAHGARSVVFSTCRIRKSTVFLASRFLQGSPGASSSSWRAASMRSVSSRVRR